MKVEKQGPGTPGDKPTTVAVPHSLTMLSPVRIASMSEEELQDVLPQLVAILQNGVLSKRPEWWPHSTIPWTLQTLQKGGVNASSTSIRNLVLKCYNFLSQHSIKSTPNQPKVLTQPRVLDWLNSNPPSRSCTQQPAKSGGNSSPKHKGGMPYLEIYLCFQCNQEFSSKDTLQKHQVQCSGNTLPMSIPSTPPASDVPSPVTLTMASDDTSSSGGSLHPASQPAASYREFLAGLDLVPVQKARKLRMARRRNTECETIDLEEPQTPISPATPRTPKLLISQLSRDASTVGGGGGQGAVSRRRLSYLRQSSDKKAEKPPGEDDEEKDSESDGESSASSADDADDPKLLKKSLFSIDVCSGLGQRVLKHMTSETHVPVITDSEQFCRTPIKDKYQDRLRIRSNTYPITWKLTSKRLRQQAHCHLYKFTRAHKFEFSEKMRTGLNAECRKLLSCVERCSVVVKRLSNKTLYKWKPSLNKFTVPIKQLTAAEILFWTQPKPRTPQPSVFPDGPTFLFTDIDRLLGLKRKDGSSDMASKLLASHCVSESANAELQLQKLTVYRSLLVDLSTSASDKAQKERGVAGKKLASTEKENYPTLYSILSGASAGFKTPQRSKAVSKTCVDVKKPLKIEIPSPQAGLHAPPSKSSSPLDDSFSIMTVSSEEDVHRNTACCSLCARRNKCGCSPDKAASSTARSSHSPSLTSKPPSSSSSLVSPAPPDLPFSPTLTPKTSMSSQPTLSPPNLSPVSLISEHSPESPASNLRSSARSNTLSPNRNSPASHLRSYLPESPLARGNRSKSPLPRGNRSKSPPAQSPGKNSESSRTSGQSQRSVDSRLPKDHAQSLLTVQRPSTRSSSKESLTSEPTDPSLLLKAVSAPAESRTRARKVSPAGSNASSTNSRAKAKSMTVKSRLTRASTQPSEKTVSAGEGTVTGEAIHSPQHQGPSHNGRSSSNSSDRSKKTEEKHSSGQNCRSNSNSPNGLKRAPTKSVAAGVGGTVRTLRSGKPGEKTRVDHETEVTQVGSGQRVNRNSKATESESSNVRKRSRGNLPAKNSEGKKMESSAGLEHLRSLRKAAEATVSQDKTRSSSTTSDPDDDDGTGNPFLVSKAQTPLFSSSIMEQARLNWHHSPKSPSQDTGGTKAVLRSGNTFRVGRLALAPPPTSFPSEVGTQPQTGGSSAMLTSPPLFGDHNTKASSSQHSPKLPAASTPGSPRQNTPHSLVGHVRNRLSPMQMLSVLESAKSSRSSGPKAKLVGRSPSRSGTNQRRLDRAFIKITGKKPGYVTRKVKEYSSPAKKARFAE
ncbi:serine/arginine repetitive matrix protein 2-like [Littorina saxatilis]|uniref:C2H2-type domain-containing protein n=1 Tax=Littorina saxatilis TaxID=31220 RepID=A0AAN9BBI8_9CAEN